MEENIILRINQLNSLILEKQSQIKDIKKQLEKEETLLIGFKIEKDKLNENLRIIKSRKL